MSWVRTLYQVPRDFLIGTDDFGAKYIRTVALAVTIGGAIIANAKPEYSAIPIASGAVYAGLRVKDLRNYVLQGLDNFFEDMRRDKEV